MALLVSFGTLAYPLDIGKQMGLGYAIVNLGGSMKPYSPYVAPSLPLSAPLHFDLAWACLALTLLVVYAR